MDDVYASGDEWKGPSDQLFGWADDEANDSADDWREEAQRDRAYESRALREDWQEILLARRREELRRKKCLAQGDLLTKDTPLKGERETIATEDAVLTATPSRTKDAEAKPAKKGRNPVRRDSPVDVEVATSDVA